MPTPFIMPKMDMDQESVYINLWLKKEGDKVEKGEPVIVIETDKITSEVEAPASGRLAGILYGENTEAPVTKVVAFILHKGETIADLPEVGGVEENPQGSEFETGERSTTSKISEKQSTNLAARKAKAENQNWQEIPINGEKITKKDVEANLENQATIKPRVKCSATPAARRMATEAKIALETIKGTGPRGRVQAQDVKAVFSEQKKTLTSYPATIAGEIVPLTNIRKRIGERLQASYQDTPHIYLTIEVDLMWAEEFRKRLNSLAAQEGADPISLTAYLVRTIAWLLKRHPLLNASLTEKGIQLWEEINIGIATAIDQGLIVPVIHNADKKSIREINQNLRYLTERARTGKLSRDEVQNGTFTISNLGMYGIESFTTIITPPQSAILAVGTVKRKPIVVDEADTIKVHPMMKMTLAVDHRLIDGAIAANFLAELTKGLETPEIIF